jgi:hypothetical protein
MASQKISQFTAITTLASGDYFPVVEASGTTNKRVEVGVFDARYTAAASGDAALSTAVTALATGNAALASGNAALVDLDGKYDKTGGPISGPVVVQSQSIGEPEVTPLASGVIVLNFSAGNNFEFTLVDSSTLGAPISPSGGQCGAITVRQDGTGSRTLAYSGGWQFAGGTAPTLTTTASGVDVLSYYVTSPTEIQTIASLDFQG